MVNNIKSKKVFNLITIFFLFSFFFSFNLIKASEDVEDSFNLLWEYEVYNVEKIGGYIDHLEDEDIDIPNISNYGYITNYLGNQSYVIVPEEIDGIKIIGIEKIDENENIFNSSLIEIYGENILIIGDKCFQLYLDGPTQLNKATFNNVVYIGNKAFYNSNIETVNIPKVIAIDDSAFEECRKLKTIDFSTAKYLGTGIFYECRKLNNIVFPAVETIPYDFFHNCISLKDITYLDKELIEVIYSNAFNGTLIKKIDFPNLYYLEYDAFENCSWIEYINLPSIYNIETGGNFENGFDDFFIYVNEKRLKVLNLNSLEKLPYLGFLDNAKEIVELNIPKFFSFLSLETSDTNFSNGKTKFIIKRTNYDKYMANASVNDDDQKITIKVPYDFTLHKGLYLDIIFSNNERITYYSENNSSYSNINGYVNNNIELFGEDYENFKDYLFNFNPTTGEGYLFYNVYELKENPKSGFVEIDEENSLENELRFSINIPQKNKNEVLRVYIEDAINGWELLKEISNQYLINGDNNFQLPLLKSIDSYKIYKNENSLVLFYILEDKTSPYDSIIIPEVRKDGYELIKWDFDFTSPDKIKKNTLVSAIWKIKKFLVIYHLDGGNNNPNNPSTYSLDLNEINLLKPKKDGYEFLGWYTNKHFLFDPITTISNPPKLTEDINLYALFKPNLIKVTFNNQQLELISDEEVRYGDSVDFTIKSLEGFYPSKVLVNGQLVSFEESRFSVKSISSDLVIDVIYEPLVDEDEDSNKILIISLSVTGGVIVFISILVAILLHVKSKRNTTDETKTNKKEKKQKEKKSSKVEEVKPVIKEEKVEKIKKPKKDKENIKKEKKEDEK